MTATSTNILKARLQLKRLEIAIDAAARENFGYCPNDSRFNELLDRRNTLSESVRKTDSLWWQIYERFSYNENCKMLPVF